MPECIWDSRVVSPSNWYCKRSKARLPFTNRRGDIPRRYEIKSPPRGERLPKHYIILKRQGSARRSPAPSGRRIRGHWSWARKSLGTLIRTTKKRNEDSPCLPRVPSLTPIHL